VRRQNMFILYLHKDCVLHLLIFSYIKFEQSISLILSFQNVWESLARLLSGSMLFAYQLYYMWRNWERTAWILIRLRGCAGWSGSMLVANALCWFCRDVAHFYFLFKAASLLTSKYFTVTYILHENKHESGGRLL
jgi:hypothetical protein